MNSKKLPMRKGVGIIVLNNKNQVFVGKRRDNPGDKWQMPQGGVDKGEDNFTAMQRELIEETSIKNIKIIKEIENVFEYELPENLVGIIWKGKFRGQKQKWFITRFLGQDSEINLNTKHPEFIEWKWLEPKKFIDGNEIGKKYKDAKIDYKIGKFVVSDCATLHQSILKKGAQPRVSIDMGFILKKVFKSPQNHSHVRAKEIMNTGYNQLMVFKDSYNDSLKKILSRKKQSLANRKIIKY